MKPHLSVNIAGIVMQNPLMNAAGTQNIESEDDAKLARVYNQGAHVQKSITRRGRQGNDQPRICEVTAGMINRIGLQNVGIDVFASEKIHIVRRILPSQVVYIVSIAGESIEDYVETATILHERARGKFDAGELNISCPNVRDGSIFACDPALTYEVTRAVRSVFKEPMGVKLSPNVTDIVPMAKAAIAGGADFISLINTLKGAAYIERGPSAGKWIEGGLSGPCIKPVALNLVRQVVKAVDAPVIAMGGISNLRDAIDFLRLPNVWGIAVGTASFANPSIIASLAKDLEIYMTENGYATIAELKSKELRR